MYIVEVFFINLKIDREDWLHLIRAISNYCGIFKKWYLQLEIENKKMRVFLMTPKKLPTTLDNIPLFIFKEIEKEEMKSFGKKKIMLHNIEENFITLYHKLKNKNENLKRIEITFFLRNIDKVYTKTFIYVERYQKSYRKRLIFSIPDLLLTVDLKKQKQFLYSKVPKYLNIQKSLDILTEKKEDAILKIDAFPYLSHLQYLQITKYDFARHSLILGSSGSGKSKLVSSMIAKLNPNNYKVIVIDPHSALESEVGGLKNTKKIDFRTKDTSIDLFKKTQKESVSMVESMLSLFRNLMRDYYNPKLERVLRNSLHLLLLKENFSFINLRKLVLELDYRMDCLNELKDKAPSNVLNFFLTDFNELKTKSYLEAIAPILTLIDQMQLLPAFTKEESYQSLEEVIDNQFLTIFSLDRTVLGDQIVKTTSALVLQQLLTLIQEKNYSQKIVLVVDEVAIVENEILYRLLSEARKYGLTVILISQYLNQVTEALKNAIFANVVNYYIFRIARIDATLLVDTLNIEIEETQDKEAKIKLLTGLNNRECLVRVTKDGKLKQALKATTTDFSSIPMRLQLESKENEVTEKRGYHEQSESFKMTGPPLRKILNKLSTTRRKW